MGTKNSSHKKVVPEEYMDKLHQEQRKLEDDLNALSNSKKHRKRLKALQGKGIDISPYSIGPSSISCTPVTAIVIKKIENFESRIADSIIIPNCRSKNLECNAIYLLRPKAVNEVRTSYSSTLSILLTFIINWIKGLFSKEPSRKEDQTNIRDWDLYATCVKEGHVQYLHSVRSNYRQKYKALINKVKEKCPVNSTSETDSYPLLQSFYEFLDRISSQTKNNCSELIMKSIFERTIILNYVQGNFIKNH